MMEIDKDNIIKEFKKALKQGAYKTEIGLIHSDTDPCYGAELRNGYTLPIKSVYYQDIPGPHHRDIRITLYDGSTYNLSEWHHPEEICNLGWALAHELSQFLVSDIKKLKLARRQARAEEREKERQEYVSPKDIDIDVFRETFEKRLKYYRSVESDHRRAACFGRNYGGNGGPHPNKDCWNECLLGETIKELESSRFSKADPDKMHNVIDYVRDLRREFDIEKLISFIADQFNLEYSAIEIDPATLTELSKKGIIIRTGHSGKTSDRFDVYDKNTKECIAYIYLDHSGKSEKVTLIPDRSPKKSSDSDFNVFVDVFTRGLNGFEIDEEEAERHKRYKFSEGNLYYKRV